MTVSGTLQFAQGLIDGFDRPAIVIDNNYEIRASNSLYRSQYGMLATDRVVKCHEVSHRYDVPCDLAGEACPLKRCKQTNQSSTALHIHHTPSGREYVDVEMWPVLHPESGKAEYFVEIIAPATIASVDGDGEPLLVGSSTVFQDMLSLVKRVSPSDSSVLLLGETGSGKELVAQTIHRLSARSDKPFVTVECSGLPESLFESEMFGFVRGAFTGALSNKDGLVSTADGGTLFLDEVGDVLLSDQVKLLRLLETQRYRKVGSLEWEASDFRLVCATNKDLWKMVSDGEFREDLYYRLNVFELHIPPLRSRKEDIAILSGRLLSQLGSQRILSPEAISSLLTYDFPGNIRELRNILERANLLSDHEVIGSEHMSFDRHGNQKNVSGTEIETLEAVELDYLRRMVESYDGTRAELADHLGLSERSLYRKLQKIGLMA